MKMMKGWAYLRKYLELNLFSELFSPLQVKQKIVLKISTVHYSRGHSLKYF